MRVAAIMIFLAFAAVADASAAGQSNVWICRMNGPSGVVGKPENYEEVDGYLVSPPADITEMRFKYKITQETDDALIAESPFPPGTGMAVVIVLLNKKTGEIRFVSLDPVRMYIETDVEVGRCGRE